MNHTSYKVSEIRYSHSKFKFAQPTLINDEGSFYRIDSTHIIDKHRIKLMKIKGDQLTLHLDTEDVVLVIVLKK
jgi:hypothetical protein